MKQLQDLAHPFARILMAFVFIMAGVGKLGNVEGFGQYMASGGIPAFLAWPAVLFEIFAGLALLVGFMTRPVALALAMFCLITALLYHMQPEDQLQMAIFVKNIGLAGGYLMFFVYGAGKYSLDERGSA